MRSIYLIVLSLICTNVFSQEITEKNVNTKVSEVTVFIDGAQVVRKKDVQLTKGESVIKFTNLSPFIDSKSVQVKVEGAVTVLSVNHQQNFLDKIKKSKELTELEVLFENITDKITMENAYLSIVNEELAFLMANRDIGGRNEQLTVENLQQASKYYSKSLTALKLKEVKNKKRLKELYNKKEDIEKQIKAISMKKEYPAGEIVVKIDSPQDAMVVFEISYMVGNAGWFPSYDIRANNINEPVQVIYKANVRQNTRVDWSNVKLRFSSSNPKVSGVAPELKKYLLNYGSVPPSYKQLSSSTVSGRVLDSENRPLPGTAIMVQGTTIATLTDVNGNYSITIPQGSNHLTFSFIGFKSQTLPILKDKLDVIMEEEILALAEVVVTGYGGKSKGSRVRTEKPERKLRGNSSQAIPTVQMENQTNVEFEIKKPYSIKSDNKSYSVDMQFYDLPAIYQYYCVPKIDKDAFLIAKVIDWEKYNLLEGEANIFFEDTYIGKTLLDMRYAGDTLEISLGRDKNVSVKREKLKDYTTKQFLGNKKEETRGWKTVVKNNKSQAINMVIVDQVPVSTLEEIEVKLQKISGAKHESDKGEIKWEFTLEPSKKKEFELKYSVKYPKFRKLMVE